MASRLVHTVVNRLKPPADGDIIVPVGTVAVLGTTDVPVVDPADVGIEPWEIDLLMAEGEVLIPDLPRHRALRAWAGVRPLWRPEPGADETRMLPRAHLILDHASRDGLDGMVSIIGGKLTTFRLMAEQAMAIVAPRLGHSEPCKTAETPLDADERAPFALPRRWQTADRITPTSAPALICECELVPRRAIEDALRASETRGLDDVRRDLRLGMGPCQAAFCGYRAAGIALAVHRDPHPLSWLIDFLRERWRGIRPLGWGSGLRQMELTRRIYLELLGLRDEGAVS
jgi:glycerol-3-phosphate dehydrogenase